MKSVLYLSRIKNKLFNDVLIQGKWKLKTYIDLKITARGAQHGFFKQIIWYNN